MAECKDCVWYSNNNSYPETGYCIINKDYVKKNDSCEDFRDDDSLD